MADSARTRTLLSTQELHEDAKNDLDTEVPGCFGCLQRRPWILPVFTAVWMIVAIFIPYGVSESLGHQSTDFPYISHTAIDDPERAIFAQTINIGALLLGLNAILRYLYIKHVFRILRVSRSWHRTNIAALFLGLISAFGLGMVANFQTELQKPPHYVGAGLAFVAGNVYCWLHTVISFHLWKRKTGKYAVFTSQLIISIAMAIFLVTFGSSKLAYKLQETSGSRKIVTPSLNGLYLTSTITEWLLAISVSCFLFTFIPDSCKIKIRAPEIEYQQIAFYNSDDENKNKPIAVKLEEIKVNRH